MGDRALNIIITSAQVPFSSGGAEILVDKLSCELKSRGHKVDVVQLPFSASSEEDIVKQLAFWRALELKSFGGEEVDLVIATKFPSYITPHKNKVLWLVHQHRQLYDLYGSRFGDSGYSEKTEALRQIVFEADKKAILECKNIYTISQNVTDRLKRYLDVDSEALLPPLPLGDAYKKGEKGDYILSVGRLCSIKRVDLIVKAMADINDKLKLKVVGSCDEPRYDEYLKNEIDKHHLWDRIEFLGRVDDQALLDLYSNAFSVYYAPFDEDYGYVTLEAMASGKPVITGTDSGGVLSFIEDGKNGLVLGPDEKSIAMGINNLFEDERFYNSLSHTASNFKLNSSWDLIIERLTKSCSVATQISATAS